MESLKIQVRSYPRQFLVMEDKEVKKAKNFNTVGIIGYVPNTVVLKTIINRATGNITVIAVANGENLNEKAVPFDKFIHIIEGRAEILIDDQSYNLKAGEAIVIPAHSRNSIKANERFKMISTVIKSGYE